MTLAPAQVRAFYDRFGARQDRQDFDERPAVDDLVAHAELSSAHSVYEAGCGTGRLAARLLATILPADARYVGTDVSDTMLDIARRRLAPFCDRALVIRQETGSVAIPLAGASVDRVITTYVVDLLDDRAIENFLAEAHRVLAGGGRLCVASLGWGSPARPSWLVARVWYALYRLRPVLVGGCRPVRLGDHLDRSRWRIVHEAHLSGWGIPSDVLVAVPI